MIRPPLPGRMSAVRYFRVVSPPAGSVTVGATTVDLLPVLLTVDGVVTVHESLRAALGSDAGGNDS